jgi:hypothetical protein
MHVLFGDETNTQAARDVEFFIYGGLILSDEQVAEVHEGVRGIRYDLGLGHREPLKFGGPRPKHVSADDHRQAKQEVLELLDEVDAVFLAYCVHHRIASAVSIGKRNEYALNTVLWGFNRFLSVEGDHGMVVLDQLRPQERFVVSRLNSEGLEMFDRRTVPVPRITGITTAHIEWSHCLSACDVILGAFRYCVNRPDTDASKEMFPIVVRQLWYREDASGRRLMRDYGLFLRPKEVKAPKIKARYDWLVASLHRLADSEE